MNVTANTEMLTQAPGATRVAAPHTFDQSSQSFGDSLFAFLKASSKTGVANDASPKAARQQKSTLEDAKVSREVPARHADLSPVLPQQSVLPQQDLLAQQVQLTLPSVTPLPLLLGGPVASPDAPPVAGDQPMHDAVAAKLVATESIIDQPGVVPLTAVQPSPAQSGSSISQVPTKLTGANTQGINALANANSNILSTTSLNASSNAIPVAVPDVPLNRASDEVQNTIQKARPTTLSPSIPNFPPIKLPIEAANAVASAVSDTVVDAFHNGLASTVQNSITSVSVNAFSSAHLDANPVQVLDAAPIRSAGGDIAPKASPIPADQVIPPSASPDQTIFAIGISVPGMTADLLVAMTQFTGGSIEAGKAGVSNLISDSLAKPSFTSVTNGKDGSNGATNDATGLKQHSLSASSKSDLQTGSQETAQTSDQSLCGTSSQGQDAASAQTNFTNHAVVTVAHTQSTIIASPVQSAPTIAGSADQKAMAQGNTAPASTAVLQPLPVINTAKLIQSIGQSEMRVGMRSNEFGNISINTSATRGLISAQISLDHSELARTLAAHLPEMQARLGSNQAVEVRIDMHGIGTGQGAGTSGGMSNGSPDQSRDGRQQPGNASSSYSGNGLAARQFLPVAAATTTGDSRLSARLDVRV